MARVIGKKTAFVIGKRRLRIVTVQANKKQRPAVFQRHRHGHDGVQPVTVDERGHHTGRTAIAAAGAKHRTQVIHGALRERVERRQLAVPFLRKCGGQPCSRSQHARRKPAFALTGCGNSAAS